MKVRFDRVFKVKPDGTLSPKLDIRFNGDHRKAGTTIFPGGSLGRVDLARHIGHDVEVEESDEAAVIMGFYP
jgi:hypothetical protein